MSRYVLKTLGCKANLVDSQRIEAELLARGWTPASEVGDASLCIINSCTVTDEADLQSRKLASRLARENPGAAVVITGCAAEVDPERLARSKGVSYVVGNQDKPWLVDLVLSQLSQQKEEAKIDAEMSGEVLGSVSTYSHILSRHPIDREWSSIEPSPLKLSKLRSTEGGRFSVKTRAFIKIQEGCNAFCTYCIIPYGRGPSRSLEADAVVAQIRSLVTEGIREVVITGTNIGHYGSDWSESGPAGQYFRGEPPLTELFARILEETSLARLRVSSLDPTEITPGLIALMEREPRFCPHFHVSVQSVSDRILRLMKRRYAAADVSRCLKRLAELSQLPGGMYVGMDLITGFPGERDEDFTAAVEFLRAHPWTRLHVFPYSERSGTPATRLPGAVPPAVRSARARALNALSLERLSRHQSALLARPIDGVLLERGSTVTLGERRYRAGYSPNYLRVLVPADDARAEPGTLVRALPSTLHTHAPAGEVSLVSEIVS